MLCIRPKAVRILYIEALLSLSSRAEPQAKGIKPLQPERHVVAGLKSPTTRSLSKYFGHMRMQGNTLDVLNWDLQ